MAVPRTNHQATSVTKQYGTFIVLAFGISWPVWILAHAFGARPGAGEEILAFGASGPALAAIILSRRGAKVSAIIRPVRLLWFTMLWFTCWTVYMASEKVRGGTANLSLHFCLIGALLALIPAWIVSGAFSADPGVRDLLRTLVYPQNWRWQAVALFFFPVLLLLPTAILRPLGVTVNSPRLIESAWSFALLGILTFLRNFFFTAVLEEPGWRGFLLPHLQQKYSPIVSSLLLWPPWALWHAPLDFTGGVGQTWMNYVEIRVIFLIPISIIMTWLYNRAGENILSTAVFHAGMNTFPFLLPYAPQALGLIFVLAAYVVVADKMWRRKGTDNTLLNRSTAREDSEPMGFSGTD